MPLITPRNRISGGPDTLCDIVMTLDQGGYWLDPSGHQTNSRKAANEMIRLLPKALNGRNADPRVPEARTTHWTTLIVMNGDVTGCRSRKSMINGTTGDTGVGRKSRLALLRVEMRSDLNRNQPHLNYAPSLDRN
uniref:Transposase n=1 Tax=Haemonchus contortus TaxID=6289 RepID=A0A7I4YFX7_HAECO